MYYVGVVIYKMWLCMGCGHVGCGHAWGVTVYGA